MDYLAFVLGALVFMTAVFVTRYVLSPHGKGKNGIDPISEGFARYAKWYSQVLLGKTTAPYVLSAQQEETTTDVTVPPFDPRHPHCLGWLQNQWEACVIEKKVAPFANTRARNNFFLGYIRLSLDGLVTSSTMTTSAADQRFRELEQTLEQSAVSYRTM